MLQIIVKSACISWIPMLYVTVLPFPLCKGSLLRTDGNRDVKSVYAYIQINFKVRHVSLYDAAGAIVQRLLFVFETFLHFPS